MKQWSILSNLLDFIQHSRFNSMNHSLDIKSVNKYKRKSNDSLSLSDREFREVDFGKAPQSLQDEYLDMNEGI